MPLPSHDAPTAETVAFPWESPRAEPPPRELHLVIAWFLDEPERTGQTALIERPRFLGRAPTGDGRFEPLCFAEARPGKSVPAPPLESLALSRRQLELEPLGNGRVRVACVGRRELLHNGVRVTECVAEAGDTLTLELTAVLLVEARPTPLLALRHYQERGFPFGGPDPQGIVGESAAIWDLRDRLAAAAQSREHVLLLGASGAGKELAARSIHQLSARRNGAFVARNAATLPDSLLDAELFGSARNYPNPGAPERPGLVGAADGGTLFLDEIGELPEAHQAHLLRVLDPGGEYHRLGESTARRSDVRLIAATNRGLDALKPDFLARFTSRISIPSLAERRSDIPFLLRELFARAAAQAPAIAARFCESGGARRLRMEPALVEVLLRHDYALQTRDLERLLQIAIKTSPTDYLAATSELMAEIGTGGVGPPPQTTADSEGREQILRALRDAGGKVGVAAERLGLSRYALRRLMRKHRLDSGR